MNKEKEVTKKEEVYYCDECGLETRQKLGHVIIYFYKEIVYLHRGDCEHAFINKILALRAEPKE